MDAEKFGAFIAGCRKEKCMTQSELAVKLQVTDKAVSRWERGIGFPDINTLEPLADALGISVLELMKSEKMEEKNDLVQENEAVLTDTVQLAVSQKKKWKKVVAVLLFVIGGLLVVAQVIEKIIFYLLNGALVSGNASMGIIGGADGPTAILVGTADGFGWFPLVAGIVLILAGIIIVKKK